MVLISRTLDKVDWHSHPGLPATHRVLAVSTQTLCYLKTVCYGPGTLVELLKFWPRPRITITGLTIEVCVLIKQGFSSKHNFILKTFLIKLSFISSLKGFINKMAAPQSLFHRLVIDTITIGQHGQGKLTWLWNTAADKYEMLCILNTWSSCKRTTFDSKNWAT